MSLIQKPCPRRQFECHRCAAKLQNSETVWELSIPTFKSWLYHNYNSSEILLGESPFFVNDPGTAPIIFQSIYQKINKLTDGSLENCNFEAENDLLYIVPADSALDPSGTPIGWPDWAIDYGIDRDHIAPPFATPVFFYIPGNFDPPVPSWKRFTRQHEALIHFLPPIIEHGNVSEPGEWRIDLDIFQDAVFVNLEQTSTSFFETQEELDAYLAGLIGSHVYIVVDLTVEHYKTFIDSASGSGTWLGKYKAPDNFRCPITPGETYRFQNIIPYDLPPLLVDGLSPVIPEGYGQPKLGVIYPLKPERDAVSPGDSFEYGDYFAPPYIDVRHVPR
tara:strand:- start:1442 stop:2440 length:999 start_codon:yes stop_codon:yes gene_type:complete